MWKTVDSVGEDFFSVSKNLIIDEADIKGNLFAFGEARLTNRQKRMTKTMQK